MVGAFMGAGAAPPANQGASGSVGVEDNIQMKRQLLAGLLGGAGGKGGNGGATGLGGLLGGGGTKSNGPPEAGVAAAQGAGATSGLPTCADDGTVTMTLRQVRESLFMLATHLTSYRSIRMVLVPSLLTSMAHLVELTSLLCRKPLSPRMFLALVFRVSLSPPTPISRCRLRCLLV